MKPGAIVLGLGVMMAAACAVSWTVAQDLAYLDPPAALEVRKDQPMALASTAELNWALGKHEQAVPLAQRAASENPLNGAGYRVLALVAAALGEEAKAQELMQLALRRTPGDMTARRWLADRAQEAGRWSEALALQDRLLRQAPEDGVDWFEQWTARLGEPDVRAAMGAVLAPAGDEPPPWREAFLRHYAANAGDAGQVDELFTAMRKLSADEATVWLSRLVADGRWQEARQRWAQRAESKPAVGGVVNGGFETEPALPPFDWTLQATPGIQVDRAPAAGRSGQALRLQFLGRRAAFDGVRQTVLLPPGRHTLRWAYRLEALNTPRGLRWVASCAGTGGAELGASALMAGQSVWREAALEFEVPAGCPAVALRLELAARIAAETQAYGTAWFDDLRLDTGPA